MAGCRCGWLLTYTAALFKDSRHHAASTSTGFASDFRRTRRHPNQPRNFSALRRYVGRIRSSLQSRCQPIHKFLRPAAFVQRTGKTTSAGLRSVRLRGKRSRLWWRWEDSNLRAPCAPVPLTHGCSCRELQNAITTLPHLHEGGAGLSRLPPLRVGCLRLAPIGTRFCFLLVLYPRKPVQLVLRMSTGSGADGRIRTCDIPPGAVLYRLSYVCIEGGARLSELPANHVMAHRRFYVSRVLSVPEHTCSKENLMASLLGTSPCVRNYNIEA